MTTPIRTAPIRTKPRSAATIESHSTASRGGKIINEKHVEQLMLHDIEDGPAEIQVTHGIKRWSSDRNDGMTIETTTTVRIPCARNEKVMADANNVASHLAHHWTWQNHRDVSLPDLDNFVKWLETPKGT